VCARTVSSGTQFVHAQCLVVHHLCVQCPVVQIVGAHVCMRAHCLVVHHLCVQCPVVQIMRAHVCMRAHCLVVHHLCVQCPVVQIVCTHVCTVWWYITCVCSVLWYKLCARAHVRYLVVNCVCVCLCVQCVWYYNLCVCVCVVCVRARAQCVWWYTVCAQCAGRVWWQILYKVELVRITIRRRITIIHALLNLAQIHFIIFKALRIFNKPF
jgi:hypothetical protein